MRAGDLLVVVAAHAKANSFPDRRRRPCCYGFLVPNMVLQPTTVVAGMFASARNERLAAERGP